MMKTRWSSRGAQAAATALVLTATASARPAHASGFLIYDASAEAMGKGSAVTASVDEPAAVWFNPGALGLMHGFGVSVGSTLVLAKSSFEPDGGGAKVDSKQERSLIPTAFAEAEVGDSFHVGLAVVPAFGLAIEWPADWVGREAAIKASIASVNFNPTLAYRINDRVGVGVGFQAVRAAVDLTNGLPGLIGGTVRVGGGTWGFGANAGLLVKAIPERLHFGLSYRSRVRLKFDGRVDFDPNPEFSSTLPDQGGKATITLPDILVPGVLWRPSPTLSLTFDPQVVFWGTYDRIVLDFESAPDKTLERRFHPAVTLRLGADWAALAPGLHLRAGLIYDQNPSPKDTLAPSLPDGHRADVGLGVGYRRGFWKADLAYLLAYFLPSKSTGGLEGPIGTYRTVTHLIGLTLSAEFGR
jgi:long-chain fatty acid transport protein